MSPGVETVHVDGPLGRWTHAHARPAHLAGLVDGIWLFDGSLTILRERTFPGGTVDIFVHLGDRYKVVEDAGKVQDWVCPAVCAKGLQLGALLVEAPRPHTEVLGIKLTPAGAYAILARPMHELTGLTVDLPDLLGASAAELADACDAGRTIEARIGAAVRWIERRLARGPRLDPCIGWIAGEVRRRRGAVSVAALRQRTGLSKNRLAAEFVHQVGVGPKHYARLERFRHVLTRLNAGCDALSDLAVASGYYDQSHMNAEFRELSGFSPTEFIRATRYPASVSVAEAGTFFQDPAAALAAR
jgi:AraC-like DNA-binding protein